MKSAIFPILFGFLIVVIVASIIGIVYYKNNLVVSKPVASELPVSSLSPSPTPSPSASVLPSPTNSAKSSAKPTTKPTPTPTPTPTPISRPSLDLRFGNPSANIKQTIDEGKGDGRVINREYSSIQIGGFDEVSSSWSPRVTVCYHIIASETIAGKDFKFTYSQDGKVVTEDTLAQYDKLESGRIYDWCHDTTNDIGSHFATFSLNTGKSLAESNYSNNLGRIDWNNIADNIAPNFTIDGPYLIDGKTCMRWIYLEDNISVYTDVWGRWNIDGAAWSSQTSENPYACISGTSGSTHTYTVHAEDFRGNVSEQKKSFVLY